MCPEQPQLPQLFVPHPFTRSDALPTTTPNPGSNTPFGGSKGAEGGYRGLRVAKGGSRALLHQTRTIQPVRDPESAIRKRLAAHTRSEEHTSELQSHSFTSHAVF